MNNYCTKKLNSWTIKNTEDYFKDILNSENKENFRIVTSKELTEKEDLKLQSLIAEWYFKENLVRTDNLLVDLLKTIKLETHCNDFIIQAYVPLDSEDVCFGLKINAKVQQGILEVGCNMFEESILKGLNNYLINEKDVTSMIIVKAYDINKPLKFKYNQREVSSYEKEIYHFLVEGDTLYGMDIEAGARVQEFDFVTNQYIGKEPGVTYIDTYSIVSHLEVDKLIEQIGIHSLNQ